MHSQVCAVSEFQIPGAFENLQRILLVFIKRSLMDCHGMVIVGFPAFECITKDGHLAGLEDLLKTQ